MCRCWYNTAQTCDTALSAALRWGPKPPEVLKVWGLQTCTSIESPGSRVLQLQGLVTIMAMSAGDSPRELQGLGGFTERSETESWGVGGQRVWWDYLTICGGIHLAIVSSPYARNPQIPTCVCTQSQRLACPVITFNRIHRTRTLLCSLHKPQPYKETACNPYPANVENMVSS